MYSPPGFGVSSNGKKPMVVVAGCSRLSLPTACEPPYVMTAFETLKARFDARSELRRSLPFGA